MVCGFMQLHRLKQQLQKKAFQPSSAAELQSTAHEDLPHDCGRHLLSCQEQKTCEKQHGQDGVQGAARELTSLEEHDCSSTQAMTWHWSGEIRAHGEDHPHDSRAGGDSLPILTREGSSISAMSAYSAEHLADAWEAIMFNSRGQAPAVQLQLSAEPYEFADEQRDTLPLHHSETTQTAASRHLSDCSRLVESEASATLLRLHASQEGSHYGIASTASNGSLTALCPLLLPEPQDRCAHLEIGAEHWHSSPVHVWPSCCSRAGAEPWKPSFCGFVADLSDSEDDDELARLEAKYGIHI